MEYGVFLLFVVAVAIIVAIVRKRSASPATQIGLTQELRSRRTVPSQPTGRGRDRSPRLKIRVVLESDGVALTDDEPSNKLRADADSFWRELGKETELLGRTVVGGVYAGHGLAAGHRWRIEPALIDPALPVDRNSPNRGGEGVPYWPSYSEISPASRAGYLEWLWSGRNDPDAYIGYVFLFFYGLERRYFLDARTSAAARNERGPIQKEVERLFAIYSSNGSFRNYAGSFLDAATAVTLIGQGHSNEPALFGGRPLCTRVMLGEVARSSNPLPADLAFTWLQSDRSQPRRTAMQRCAVEFKRLFAFRYRETFGEGLLIQPIKTKMKATYHPASPSFGEIEIDVGDMPEIGAQTALLSKLSKLADDCANDLEAFSRWIAKNPAGQTSIAAVSLLPQELVAQMASPTARNLTDFLDDRLKGKRVAIVGADELFMFWPFSTPPKMKRTEAVLLSQAMQKLGFGLEPDVRFGGSAPATGEDVVIFPISKDAPSAPSKHFSAAAMLLHLSSIISMADDTVSGEERNILEAHLSRALDLPDHDRARLGARLEWLLHEQRGTAGLKKQIEKLTESQRQSIAEFLVGVAAADGQIAPAEVNALSKMYKLLGLSAEDVYGDLHAAAVSQSADEPVPVIPASQKPSGYRIPKESTKVPTLDPAVIERKLAETAAVSAMLSDIFEPEEEQQPIVALSPAAQQSKSSVAKLGIYHAAFMQALATRSEWQRSEVEQLAADAALLTDGALEKINEFGFERCGEAFCEGEDIIYINHAVAQELMS